MKKGIKLIGTVSVCIIIASCIFAGCRKESEPAVKDVTTAVPSTETTTTEAEITDEYVEENLTEAEPEAETTVPVHAMEKTKTVNGKTISALSREELYTVYRNVLVKYVPVTEAEEYGEPENATCLGYALYDMDNDGIYELIVDKGTCEADREWVVYKLKHNSSTDAVTAEEIGSCTGSQSILCVPSDRNGIISYGGHMGSVWVYRMTLNDGTFSAEKIYSGENRESKEIISATEREISESDCESYGQCTLLKKIILDNSSEAVTHKEAFSGIY